MSEQLNCRELPHLEMGCGDQSLWYCLLLAVYFIAAVSSSVAYRPSHSAAAAYYPAYLVYFASISRLAYGFITREKCLEMCFGEIERRKASNTERAGSVPVGDWGGG